MDPRSELTDVDHRQLDSLRKNEGEIENHVIDEFVAGRISRREFMRRGTVIGMSIPLLSKIAFARRSLVSPSTTSTSKTPAAKAGATIRVGTLVPAGAISPLLTDDRGGEQMLGQTGEFLVLSNQKFELVPSLATSWSSNSKATVWTFKIRQGVKFSDGSPLTADDVVYTYKLQSDPKNSSTALSNFAGLLVPDGVQKVDDFTVRFHLEQPDGAFSYACSSDNWRCCSLESTTLQLLSSWHAT